MNVFYDLGAGSGTDIKLFYNMYNKIVWDVHAFEIQEKRVSKIKEKYPNINVVNAAAGSYNGTADFYHGKSENGTSLMAGKSGVNVNNKETVNVVDFAEYMSTHSNKDDNIIVLIDIEGGEYELVEHLKATGKIDWIDELYIEFHGHKLKGFDIQIEDDMVKYLIDKFDDKVYIYRKHQHEQFLKLNAEGR